jgi:dihydroxyacid dehydratase/phosphogluconate dehydratase
MRNLLELNLKPRDIMTRDAFENAMVGFGRVAEGNGNKWK